MYKEVVFTKIRLDCNRCSRNRSGSSVGSSVGHFDISFAVGDVKKSEQDEMVPYFCRTKFR
jgi:hypothetical protein